MIFVPMIQKKNSEELSKVYFFCSKCTKWYKICGSVKNIKRHAGIHVPEIFRDCNKNDKVSSLTEKREEKIVNNMVGFILFETNTFQSIESSFLSDISEKMPNKSKLVKILKNISQMTQKEIKKKLAYSACNCLSFDEWTDLRNRKFLGVTIRSFINMKYEDFFLDFIYFSDEINDADVLTTQIIESLAKYDLNVDDILSCSTDNCNLMCKTSENLNLWRIPCVLHMLNLIFKVFVESISKKITPIFDLIKYLSNSEHYENYLSRKAFLGLKIKKVPSYVEVRWTSFCESILILYETKPYICEFLATNKILNNIQSDYLEKLAKLCEKYKMIVLTYEKDIFGAS